MVKEWGVGNDWRAVSLGSVTWKEKCFKKEFQLADASAGHDSTQWG